MDGYCDSAFAQVREVFEASFADGRNLGGAVAVSVGGTIVVDLWGGVADRRSGRVWERDTPCVCFSSTKALTATAALQVADGSGVDLEAPVLEWWPEFGTHGKAATTLTDLLTHRAGLPAFDRPVTAVEAQHPDQLAAQLAGQTPEWEPGARHGYHALTFGWLVGEFVRRATGDTVGAYVRRNFGEDLAIGARPDEIARAARMANPPAEETISSAAGLDPETVSRLVAAYADPNSAVMRGTTNPIGSFNSPDVLAGGWPGAGLVTTARALATFYADLIGGKFLSRERLRDATRERVRGADAVLLLESAFGLGYMLPAQNFPVPAAARGGFGHPGAGGSAGFGDVGNDLAFAFVPNLRRDSLAGDRRAFDLLDAVYGALAKA